jgi:mannose-6-phosphate isomerase-like protein (cupin superfamily)
MSFDSAGYALTAEGAGALWFLDTRMTVLAGGEQTRGGFTFLQWEAPEGFGPPRHIHHHEEEAFYLLEGEMTVRCGDREWAVGPAGFVLLPRGIPHAFVVTRGPARGLQITAPSGFERYIAELGRPAERPGLPDATPPDVAALTEAGTRHGYEMVGPPLNAGAAPRSGA